MRHYGSIDLMAIVFTLGCVPLMFLPSLPSETSWLVLAGVFIVIILVWSIRRHYYLCVIAVFILSFLWSTANAKQYLSLIEPYIDQTLVVTAKVETINTQIYSPKKNNPYYAKFSILKISDQILSSPIPIIIYWQQSDLIKAGQIWQLTIKTKVTKSYLN